jgi:2-phosphoglycerate kinase
MTNSKEWLCRLPTPIGPDLIVILSRDVIGLQQDTVSIWWKAVGVMKHERVALIGAMSTIGTPSIHNITASRE